MCGVPRGITGFGKAGQRILTEQVKSQSSSPVALSMAQPVLNSSERVRVSPRMQRKQTVADRYSLPGFLLCICAADQLTRAGKKVLTGEIPQLNKRTGLNRGVDVVATLILHAHGAHCHARLQCQLPFETAVGGDSVSNGTLYKRGLSCTHSRFRSLKLSGSQMSKFWTFAGCPGMYCQFASNRFFPAGCGVFTGSVFLPVIESASKNEGHRKPVKAVQKGAEGIYT